MRSALLLAVLLGCNGDDGTQTGDTGPIVDTDDTDPGTTSTGQERIDTILTLTGDTAAGETQYGTICLACHGAAGEGSINGPALTERIPLMLEEDVVSTVLNGIGNMDAYDFLKNQEVADVVAYAVTTFGS